MECSEQEPSGGSQSVSSVETYGFSGSEEFPVIRYTKSFIDKSLLIRELLQGKKDPVVLVTAPRRFGKSVNMSMVRHFVEKQVDKLTGEEIPQDCKGSNRSLFQGLKIMKEEKLKSMHFGKYPVLKANFLCPVSITNVEDALDFCKKIIHEAFIDHFYLCNSTKLEEDDKKACKAWCNSLQFQDIKNCYVADGLKLLSRYLWLHYDRKVKIFVTIDEYDSVYNQAMSEVTDRELLKKIIKQSISLVTNLVKGNEYVAGVFLTGISHISGLGLSSALGSLSTYRFLRKSNKFNCYYGFTQDEVKELFTEYNIPADVQNQIKEFYNGYQSEDEMHCVYNTWSVVKYLDERSLDNYWVKSGAIETLTEAFKIDEIKGDIEKAIMSFDGVANITPLGKCEMEHFYQLYSLYSNSKQTSKDKNYAPTPQLFFTFLLDQGYFTYAGAKSLKIPNQEIRMELHEKLTEHFQKTYGFNNDDIIQCIGAFQNIFNTMPVDTEKLLEELKESLEQFFVTVQQTAPIVNHSLLQQALFTPLFQIGFKYCTEIRTPENKKTDCFLFKDGIGVIIELKYMSTDSDSINNSENALKQILEKKYYSLFANTNYLSNIPNNYLLLGLSFNRELKVSMHCLESHQCSKIINFDLNADLPQESVETLIGEAITIPFCKQVME